MKSKKLKQKLDEIIYDNEIHNENLVVVCSFSTYADFIKNFEDLRHTFEPVIKIEQIKRGFCGQYRGKHIFCTSKMEDVNLDFLVLRDNDVKRFGVFCDLHGEATIDRWWEFDREYIQGLIDKEIMHKALK